MKKGEAIFLFLLFVAVMAAVCSGNLASESMSSQVFLDKKCPDTDSLIREIYWLEIENSIQREVFGGEIWEDVWSDFGKVNHAWREIKPGDTMWVTKDSTRKTIVSYER